MSRNRTIFTASVLTANALLLCACNSDAHAEEQTVVHANSLHWETKSSGVQVAQLYGDPAQAGPFGLRLKYPPGYQKDPHYHPYDAAVTVLSGLYYRGYGAEFDRSKGIHLSTGTFSVNPAGVSHYEWVDEPAELEVHAVGPWGSAFVDANGQTLDPDTEPHRGDACGGAACHLGSGPVSAVEHPPIVIKPADMKWTTRDDGDEVALLFGDPGESGPFVLRLRSKSTSREQPHHHPRSAYITVLSGDFHFGIGERVLEAEASKLQVGDVLRVRPELPHFKWNERASVVEIHATGPWSTTWLHR